MNASESAEYILNSFYPPTFLCQLAEEASELAQAALKVNRILCGTNRPAKSWDDCFGGLIEEIADVQVVASIIISQMEIDRDEIEKIMEAKLERWAERIKKEKEHPAPIRIFPYMR